MRKTVKTGRGTGKTIETMLMMKEQKNLYTIVPRYMLNYDLFRDICTDLGFSKDTTDDIMKRIVDCKRAEDIFREDINAKFHVEEADRLLEDFIGVPFDTMTTSHWHVETFKRNEYEKEGL